jgi:hypothetical protein
MANAFMIHGLRPEVPCVDPIVTVVRGQKLHVWKQELRENGTFT